MTLFWTDKLFVFAIYQHGSHGMEWRAITAVASLSIVLWASTILNFIRKVVVMIRCLMNNAACHSPPAWNGLISDLYRETASAALVATARILWVCSTSSSVTSILQSANQNGSLYQSHQQHRYSNVFKSIWDTPCPEKIAQKNLKTMSWWWLTDWGPRVTMVVGLDLDTNRHGIPIPQGWITPTTRNPSPLWIYPRTHQEAIL